MYEQKIQRFLQLRARKLDSQPGGDADDGQQPPFEARTYLFIRAFEGDTGSRPVPPGTVFWLSPDIEVFDPALGRYVLESTLVPGRPYRVDVTVNNGGDLPTSVCNVDLFVTDFTVGFSNPPRVGSPQLLSVPPRGRAVASFPYTPEASGHRCLFTRAWSLPSMDYPGCENVDHKLLTGVVDHTATVRQIGQQNLDVVQQGQSLDVQLAAGALRGAPGHLLVQAAAALPARLERKLPGTRFAALTLEGARKLDGVRITNRGLAVITRPPARPLPVPRPPPIQPQLASCLTVRPSGELPPFGPLVGGPAALMRSWKLEGAGAAPEVLRLELPQLGLAAGEMTAVHLWLVGADGARHGGATVIVKA